MPEKYSDSNDERLIAHVYLIDSPYAIDKEYDYYIPKEFEGELKPGQLVSVPFGGGNRRLIAVVMSIDHSSELGEKYIKPIDHGVNAMITLDAEMLKLCSFLKEHTFCTFGDAVRAVLPAAAISKLSDFYTVVKDIPQSAPGIGQRQLIVYNFIKNNGRVTPLKLKQALGDKAVAELSGLLSGGYIKHEAELKKPSNIKYKTYISLKLSAEEAYEQLGATSVRQREIIGRLEQLGRPAELTELLKELGCTIAPVNSLAQRGIVELTKLDAYRDPYEAVAQTGSRYEPELNDEQRAAVDEICALCDSGEPKAALLHGVTGSGKTRVILEAIDHVLESGRSVIMLVPEISLTPQTVEIFRARYGGRIAVVHSGLSEGERFDAWRRMRSGEAEICIGTRSAIFAPFNNIGLIVIDEEHEHTYKSDMNPKYHARDIARVRCAHHSAVMLLASATPSVESYYKAEIGKYSLIELKKRVSEQPMPDAVIVDMRPDAREGRLSPIGARLESELRENLENGKKAILFVNRRGYNNLLSCPKCGKVLLCPHCSVALSYHKGSHDGALFCHYCGYAQSVPEVCPECGNDKLRFMGFGTQKVEEELPERIPGVRVLRMDADTTSAKFSYNELLERFRNGESDILLGTQMVAKGHDFPDVTLVGVLSADQSLYQGDYRASEHTFALITQVIGRAGRGDTPGRAIIQTYSPEHPTIKLAAAQDYQSFYKNDIALRRALVFPPFCDIALLTVTSENENEAIAAATELKRYMNELMVTKHPYMKYIAFGPFEAPVYKVMEKYRMRIVVKCRLNKDSRAYFSELLMKFNASGNIKFNVTIDINPNSL